MRAAGHLAAFAETIKKNFGAKTKLENRERVSGYEKAWICTRKDFEFLSVILLTE